MSENITIKKAGIKDVTILQEISKQTTLETFAEVSKEENMKKYLEQSFSIEKLTEELNNPESEFYLAYSQDEVIGYLKINTGKAQKELQDSRAVELERIYVYKKYHGKNVGQMLFDKAISIAKQRKSEYIWLGVWELNHRAMSFYKKNGFVIFGEHKFIFGDEEVIDLMLKLELKD